MRKLFVPLILAASLGTAGAAFATTTTGTVDSINLVRPSVTLADGTEYLFPDTEAAADRLDNFKPGDMVIINWVTNGTGHDANSISPAN
jgi:hypothetical protein